MVIVQELFAVVLPILWNHFFSWRSMFVDSQNCPGLWGRYFIGSVIEIILINIKKMIVF